MASVQDLKRRIRSVRNTRKITRAMELVAAAKLRRAEQRITALRPYAETMNELIAGVGARRGGDAEPRRAADHGAPTLRRDDERAHRGSGEGGLVRSAPAPRA